MNVQFRAFNGVTDWGCINKHIAILRTQDTGGIIAYNVENGEMLGAFIWDNVTKNTLQCHIVITSKVALRHGFLNEIANFVFNVQAKKAMYAMITSDNAKSLRFTKKVGFTEKTRFKDGWCDGVDYVMVELLKTNCIHL